jgi:hypothetical protein
MLATFCLRLACGLAAALLLLSPRQVQARFYRTQFLTILGLCAAALILSMPGNWLSPPLDWLLVGAGLLLAFLGSIAWSLQDAPGGRVFIGLLVGILSVVVIVNSAMAVGTEPAAWKALAGLTAAGVLGAAMTAMLMGHSYLIAPGMAIDPLLRLLQALFVALLLRMTVAGLGLWFWTTGPHDLAGDTLLWLPVRWGVGFLGPLVLGWMAWQTAKIRSTQSATGILYVVVICCFLGELTGQLLQSNSGLSL